jgi:hypothetical protein
MVTIVIGNDAFPVTEKAILRVAARQIEEEILRCNDADLRAFIDSELQDKEFLEAVWPYLNEAIRQRLECQGGDRGYRLSCRGSAACSVTDAAEDSHGGES